MSDALDAVQGIYFSVQSKQDSMMAAAANDDDRATINGKIEAAEKNYDDCVGQAFQDDDPELKGLVDDAKADKQAIDTIDAQLGDITKVITTLTHAVTTGASIAAKVMAV